MKKVIALLICLVGVAASAKLPAGATKCGTREGDYYNVGVYGNQQFVMETIALAIPGSTMAQGLASAGLSDPTKNKIQSMLSTVLTKGTVLKFRHNGSDTLLTVNSGAETSLSDSAAYEKILNTIGTVLKGGWQTGAACSAL